jgi:hypothetical protein
MKSILQKIKTQFLALIGKIKIKKRKSEEE